METSQTIAHWGDATFGVATSKALAQRAQEELHELIEAIDASNASDSLNIEQIAMEAADVTILLHRLVGDLGLDLSETVERKMEINRARQWTTSGDGTGQHKP